MRLRCALGQWVTRLSGTRGARGLASLPLDQTGARAGALGRSSGASWPTEAVTKEQILMHRDGPVRLPFPEPAMLEVVTVGY